MSEQEFRRRVMAGFGISGDKWDGFDFGYLGIILKSTPSIEDKVIKMAYTPFVEVTAGHSITWNDNCANGLEKFGSGRYTYLDWAFTLQWYDANKTKLNINGRSIDQPRTLAVPAGAKYCKMNISLDEIAGAYVKDATTGEYLWRGSDYVE